MIFEIKAFVDNHGLMRNSKISSLLIFRASAGPIRQCGVDLNISSEIKYLGHDELNDKDIQP